MGDPHDHDPGASDDLLTNADIHVIAGNPDVSVTVPVPVDGGTLDGLANRAHREGREIEHIVATVELPGARSTSFRPP